RVGEKADGRFFATPAAPAVRPCRAGSRQDGPGGRRAFPRTGPAAILLLQRLGKLVAGRARRRLHPRARRRRTAVRVAALARRNRTRLGPQPVAAPSSLAARASRSRRETRRALCCEWHACDRG